MVENILGHKFTVLNPYKSDFLMTKRHDFFMMEYAREWGIEKFDLQKFLSMLVTNLEFSDGETPNLNTCLNKMGDAKTIATNLYYTIEGDYQYKPYLKSACIIILLGDEKPDDPYEKYLEEKLKLCELHSEIEGFFLANIKILEFSLKNRGKSIPDWDYFLPKKGEANLEKSTLRMIQSSPYSVEPKS